MKRIRYLNIDMSRAFGSWKIAVGSLGVCLTLLYNSSGAVSVLGWLSNIAGNAVLIMAALIFSVYPYAAAFCDDMEYCYDRQMVLRGSAASYSLSKMTAVFLSAAFTMFSGFVLAVLFLLVRYGLPDAEFVQQVLDNCVSLYKPLLVSRYFLLFAFCIGIHLAVLAGTLAVIGLMCSLFVKNRMLVYILPVAFLYIEDILVQRMMGWELGSLFSLNCMGVTVLGSSLKIHTWQLYYLEIFLLLLFIGAVICIIYRRKVA
ncbi:MAG: hypothetical protein K2J90_04125 [Lachnospiraceae bacterium]|nr:hypothetical protein [Lachnospiraceae bacterium]